MNRSLQIYIGPFITFFLFKSSKLCITLTLTLGARDASFIRKHNCSIQPKRDPNELFQSLAVCNFLIIHSYNDKSRISERLFQILCIFSNNELAMIFTATSLQVQEA